MPEAFPFVVELVSISVACRGPPCDKSRSAFLVATLITETTDELLAREAIRLAARLQHLCFGNPGGLALQYPVQFPPPLVHSALHPFDREPQDPGDFFCGKLTKIPKYNSRPYPRPYLFPTRALTLPPP